MTLDESQENDEQFHKNDVLYLVDKTLLARCGKISVDFIEEDNWSGFAIIPEHPLPLFGGC